MTALVLLGVFAAAVLAPSWLLRLLDRAVPEFRYEEGELERAEDWPRLLSFATPRWRGDDRS